MPMVIPLIAAGASIYAGVAAVSAGAMLVGGAMIAGGAMTAIGSITKNPKLTKIGGLVSLAGGIGGLATGAWSSAASTIAGEAGLGDAAANAAQIAGGAGDAAANASQIAGGMGDLASNASQIATSGGAAQTPGMLEATGAMTPPPSTVATPSPVDPTASTGAQSAVNTPQEAFRTTEIAAQNARSPWMDTANDVAGWMKRNKDLVNTGSGIISGAMKNASDQDLMKERWKQEDAALAKRRADISASIMGLKVPTYSMAKG